MAKQKEAICYKITVDSASEQDKEWLRGVVKQARSKGLIERWEPPKQKSTKPKDSNYSEDFETFWSKIPHKLGKGNAWQAWQAALKRKHSPETIIKGVTSLIRYESQRKSQDPNQFRPLHPSTWLNGDRFLDEVGDDPTKPRKTKLDRATEEAEAILGVRVSGMDKSALSECLAEGLTRDEIYKRQKDYDPNMRLSEYFYRITEEIALQSTD